MDSKQIAEKLTLWIKEKVTEAGRGGAVFGLSGGIDSSVVSVLCKQAFPENNLLGVIMPCHSSPQDEEHALLVANKFSIPTKKVALDDIYDAFLKIVPQEKQATPRSRLAKANIKARLRMLTLYYFANKLNYLVVGSSDRSEIAMGYFTKYGDGGVDIMPIGCLLKGEVKELARYLGIPRPIIDKPPTAGLWEGQTAEGEMGLLYADIDRYILTGKANTEVKKKIKSRVDGCAHKRSMPPIASI